MNSFAMGYSIDHRVYVHVVNQLSGQSTSSVTSWSYCTFHFISLCEEKQFAKSLHKHACHSNTCLRVHKHHTKLTSPFWHKTLDGHIKSQAWLFLVFLCQQPRMFIHNSSFSEYQIIILSLSYSCRPVKAYTCRYQLFLLAQKDFLKWQCNDILYYPVIM